MPSTDQFYTSLPVNSMELPDLFIRGQLFHKIPADWHVIITDIKSSTTAVNGGVHETVNLIATGSIVAVLNIVYKNQLTIPFFFGGDGATFIVPPSVKNAAMHALLLHKENTRSQFNLHLRVGTVPVSDIYGHGVGLKISKLKTSEIFSIPVVLGDGLSYAEKLIKGEDYSFSDQLDELAELDLNGMECRWDRIDPPESNYEVVSLLAVATSEAKQPKAFRKVMKHIDAIYGTPQARSPISAAKLQLKITFNRMGLEMKARLGKVRLLGLIGNWLKSAFGYFWLRSGKGKIYLNRLIEMSDTLVIDGRINTIITGKEIQRVKLQSALDKMETAGEIVYGLYASNASVMSCYVRDMQEDHIHFVDGAEGGYTRAAGELKKKFGTGSKQQVPGSRTGLPK